MAVRLIKKTAESCLHNPDCFLSKSQGDIKVPKLCSQCFYQCQTETK